MKRYLWKSSLQKDIEKNNNKLKQDINRNDQSKLQRVTIKSYQCPEPLQVSSTTSFIVEFRYQTECGDDVSLS